MWNNGKKLKEQLVNIERLRVAIMEQINRINENEEAVIPTKVYPVAKVKPLEINGYPVMHFNYDGILPTYIDNQEYIKYLRSYYFHSTMAAYDFDEFEGMFDNAVIVSCQYFKNNVIRDLDNRNSKYIQDAIRATLIIKDDNWQNIWNLNIGLSDKERDHVQIYVLEQQNAGDFYTFLLENHERLKRTDEFALYKDEFLDKHRKKIRESENLDEETLLTNKRLKEWFPK